MHLRGYHLKANRLFEPTSQTAGSLHGCGFAYPINTAKISETSLIHVNAVGAVACYTVLLLEMV
jgi:hypothetical protein